MTAYSIDHAPTHRYTCVIESCPWTHDVYPHHPRPGDTAGDHYRRDRLATEAVLKMHMEQHSREELAAEIMRLRRP